MKKFFGKIGNFFKKVFGAISNFFNKISNWLSKKVGKLSNRTREILAGFIFISPWIIGFAIFGLYPIVYSFYLSLCKAEIKTGIVAEFTGITNYIDAFKNASMMTALLDFLKESLFMVFIINVFAILFAVILNSKIKGKGFFRTIFFLPVVVVSGPVVVE